MTVTRLIRARKENIMTNDPPRAGTPELTTVMPAATAVIRGQIPVDQLPGS